MADILTNSGEDWVVDKLDESVSGTTEYIGWGSGSTAPQKTDTDLDAAEYESRVSGVRTQYATDTVQWEGTITSTANRPIVECGLFSAAGAGNPPSGGDLFSRHTFSVINVETDDQITFRVRWEIQ